MVLQLLVPKKKRVISLDSVAKEMEYLNLGLVFNDEGETPLASSGSAKEGHSKVCRGLSIIAMWNQQEEMGWRF